MRRYINKKNEKKERKVVYVHKVSYKDERPFADSLFPLRKMNHQKINLNKQRRSTLDAVAKRITTEFARDFFFMVL
jgi:hypothetical protein